MSYRALYRVWRPQYFRDLVGQEHVTTTLANALTGGHISHAYLFSGPRGTGKTSAAKIFAKAVNCIHGPTAEPCNDCPACIAITEGTVLDVVEIDAASNRGVDEIRDLRDKVKYAPTEVRYKVYIIDEVHMLTTEAFNALLKTLEEPPAHVIFVLATTEPHKLPATIVSRCQRFPFRRISDQKVVERLVQVVEQENISYQPAALELIARFAEGGLRDALSLLDQAISFSGEQLTEEIILSIVGGISDESLFTLLDALQANNSSLALAELDRFFTYGVEVDQVVHDLLRITRDLLLAKSGHKARTGDLVNQAAKFSTAQLITWADQLVLIGQQLKWVSHPQLLLELFVIRQAGQYETTTEYVKQQPIQREEHQLQQPRQHQEKAVAKVETSTTQASTPIPTTQTHTPIPTEAQPPVQASTLASSSPKILDKSLVQVWPDILQSIKQQRMTLYAWLADAEIVDTSNQSLSLTFVGDFHCNTVSKPENKQFIEQEIQRVIGSSYELKAYTRDKWEQKNSSVVAKAETSITNSTNQSVNDIVEKAVALFGEELVTVEDN